ncbi:MAG: hypothetical protein PHW03_02115 [Eubacteriales bacterium]|nr:hypothetical protein [Eubacteriales bacterium]MDD4389578.1 hypothetical protein [Eubacteriales bacterium]
MTKREKNVLLALRIFAALMIAYGAFILLFSSFGAVFMGFGGVLFVLIFGLKCNYEDAAEERALLKQERLKEKQQKETDLT